MKMIIMMIVMKWNDIEMINGNDDNEMIIMKW